MLFLLSGSCCEARFLMFPPLATPGCIPSLTERDDLDGLLALVKVDKDCLRHDALTGLVETMTAVVAEQPWRQ